MFLVKIFISIFFVGILIGGIVKLSPSHRNPEISKNVENLVGVFGLILGLAALYFTWIE